MSQYPRVESISDLVTFDYKLLFPGNDSVSKFFDFFSHPIVPVVGVFLYLTLSKTLFDGIRKTFNLQPKGAVVQGITIVHSALLAVYSGWTCYNCWGIVIPYVAKHGFVNAICDVNGELWNSRDLRYWVTHFYISKYYEFIDTWIILLKGREPMFLQTYHHAGVVFIMWGGVVTQSSAVGGIIICLNSFIHTLMYAYYTLAAFGYSSPLKHYLTTAQMTSFLIGIIIVTLIYPCSTPAQALMIASAQFYVTMLTYLFYLFYKASYGKKKKEVKKSE